MCTTIFLLHFTSCFNINFQKFLEDPIMSNICLSHTVVDKKTNKLTIHSTGIIPFLPIISIYSDTCHFCIADLSILESFRHSSLSTNTVLHFFLLKNILFVCLLDKDVSFQLDVQIIWQKTLLNMISNIFLWWYDDIF